VKPQVATPAGTKAKKPAAKPPTAWFFVSRALQLRAHYFAQVWLSLHRR
jgi:hypothetical protein